MTDDTAPAGRLRSVLDWLREGYPAGVPPTDYIPLLALLRRRLTEEEVREIAAEIAQLEVAEQADIGVRITRITDALPSADDVARVEARLTEHHGWPLDDDAGR
jgi:hypothetical protein